MSQSKSMRMVELWDLLRERTDEDYPMSTGNIVARLQESGGGGDRRTLPRDIKQLKDSGREVMSEMKRHTMYYWFADRLFSTAELQILADGVQAARYLTPAKTHEMIFKISSIAGGDVLSQNFLDGLIPFNTRKHTNEAVFTNVSTIGEAIRKKKWVSFLYFHLNERHERDYGNHAFRYFVAPKGLAATEDNYYLVGYSLKDNASRCYRLDRMEQVDLESESFSEEEMAIIPDIETMMGQSFKMYTGETVTVTLEFPKKLVEQIYDRFGDETPIEVLDDGQCRVTQEVQPSPTFYSWVFTYGSEMKIVAPERIALKMKNLAEEVMLSYCS